MNLKFRLLAMAAAAVLASCGGGVDTTAVRVVGDSLADNGTFGFKFTVQGTAAAPHHIWSELVTSAVGAPALCSRYVATSASTVALNPAAAACTSYGVGGGRVNPMGTAGNTSPFSIVQQLKDMAAAGNFGGEELLLADGGGNDMADLVGAFLVASTDGGAAYVGLLGELLTPAQVGAAAAGGQAGLVTGGTQYATALANVFADALTTHALNKGATRVVVVNAPNVVKTPRFQAVLAGVSAASGGGATGHCRRLGAGLQRAGQGAFWRRKQGCCGGLLRRTQQMAGHACHLRPDQHHHPSLPDHRAGKQRFAVVHHRHVYSRQPVRRTSAGYQWA